MRVLAGRRLAKLAREDAGAPIFGGAKMPRKISLPLSLCVICCALSAPVFADEIKLKNGDRLTGTIIKSDGKNLTLKSEFLGAVNITWDAVEQITSAEPLHLNLNDGQTLVGVITTSAEKYEIATKDAGTVSIAKASIKTIRNQEEQTAYLAEIDRLRNPGLLDLWAGTL